MRLKVLYTFDAEGKQTCLARWHQFVYTPVYHVNPDTPIGVVDLKTCVNSIASSSPELVALLDKDYSVYSYDYSEEGTPLQGLGLLSWIMGSGATTSNGGASQQGSSRLITGRVVSAQMGLFQNEKETLEVKMKLAPVSSIKQSDYINSMNVYNTLSQIIPGNFDASSWSAYYQANQGWLQAAATGNAGSRLGGNGGCREAAAHAPVPHQLYPQAPTPAPTHGQAQHYQHQQHQLPQQYQQPMHHQPSPQQVSQQAAQQAPQHASPQQPPPPPHEPAPQAAVQPPAPLQTIPQQTVAPPPVVTHPVVEESEAPKKKPRKRNPRAPVANNNGGRKKSAVPAPSIPSAASTPAASQSDAYAPAYQAPSESTFASPDLPRVVPVRQSYAHSPLADIPSVETFVSTPQMEVPGSSPPTDDLQHVGESPRQDYSPAPTSPILPMQNDCQQEIADRLDLNKELDTLLRAQQQKAQQVEEKVPEQEQIQEKHQRQEHTREHEETNIETPSQALLPPPASQTQVEAPGANQTPVENIEQTVGPYPEVVRQFACAANDSFVTAAPSPLCELQVPNTLLQDKPAKKKRKYVRKKGLMSDVVGPSETGDEESREVKIQGMGGEEIIQEAEVQVKPKKSKSMSGRADGEKKNGDEVEKQNRAQGPTSAKERIEAQLREALKEGKMPNYCGNCGAIETPTWRRVSLKDENGDPEKDQNILLCNPCGLWHATKKSMRPPGLWDPKKDDGPPKRSRNNRKRKATGAPHTDIPQEPEHHAQPAQQMVSMSEPIVIEDGDDVPVVQASRRAKTPGAGHSATIKGWAEMVRNNQRRIQSSPVKRDGTMDSPIELDTSPCPLRRALFPLTPIHAALDSGAEKRGGVPLFGVTQGAKENVTPTAARGTPKTPKRRRLATPDRRTPSRAVARRSPFAPQRDPGTTTTTMQQFSPTSDLLNRFLSDGNEPNVSSAEFNSWFNVDSEDAAFTTDDMMPSSPPPFFGLYEDDENQGDSASGGGVWTEFLPDGVGDGYDGLDGILGTLDTNILDGGSGKSTSAGGVGTQVTGSGMVDFSVFFGEEVVVGLGMGVSMDVDVDGGGRSGKI